MNSRRQFLSDTGFIAGGLALASTAMISKTLQAAQSLTDSPEAAARDEAFWATFRRAFSPDPRHVWFNCLAYNPTPATVHAAFLRKERQFSEWPLTTRREVFDQQKRETLRSRLAGMLQASPEEIALTRNTTESIANVIFGLPLSKGDEIVLTNQEYDTFQNAWTQRERRDGIVLRRVVPPVPADKPEALLESFRAAITPRTRVVMFSHLSDPTGQIFPARAIADLAHKVGAQVIADGALSFGCIPVDVKEMDCDYYGTSLHKGVFAPTGTGLLYVKRECIPALWPLYGAPEGEAADIRKFEHRGTSPITAFSTVTDALDVHGAIGVERMAARYRYLKRLWADRLSGNPRCHLNVRLEPEHSCGIASIAIEGVQPRALYDYLYQKRGLSTWPIETEGLAGLWISPYPFTTPAELDRLANALIEIAERGLPRVTQ